MVVQTESAGQTPGRNSPIVAEIEFVFGCANCLRRMDARRNHCGNQLTKTSVPYSCPELRSRKALSLLDVPQSQALCGYTGFLWDLPPCRATGPVCAPEYLGGGWTRSLRRNRPQSPCRAPCAEGSRRSEIGDGRRSEGGRKGGQKEEKLRFFSRFTGDLFASGNKRAGLRASTSARNGGPRS